MKNSKLALFCATALFTTAASAEWRDHTINLTPGTSYKVGNVTIACNAGGGGGHENIRYGAPTWEEFWYKNGYSAQGNGSQVLTGAGCGAWGMHAFFRSEATQRVHRNNAVDGGATCKEREIMVGRGGEVPFARCAQLNHGIDRYGEHPVAVEWKVHTRGSCPADEVLYGVTFSGPNLVMHCAKLRSRKP